MRGPVVLVSFVIVAAFLVAVSGLFAEPVDARSTGITGYSGNPDAGEGATCADCHGNNEPKPIVSIGAPDSVVGGETIVVTVTITGGPGVEAGFNASVSDLAGEFDIVDSDTRIASNEITHTAPKTMGAEGATFTFTWTAPTEAGTASIYAAGLSTNGSGNNLGDAVGTAVRSVQVEAPSILGDVNCSGEVNIVDALMIAQFAARLRTDGVSCPLADQTRELLVAQSDVNGDQQTDIVDALVIAQCDAGLNNVLCPA